MIKDYWLLALNALPLTDFVHDGRLVERDHPFCQSVAERSRLVDCT
jgi:hypothetical protein